MKNIKDGLPTKELDNSTYQLYYSDQKSLSIRQKMEKLFKEHNELDIDSIIRFFDGEYTEWEVRNTVKSLLDKSDENMYYRDYVNLYSRSNVNKIIDKVSEMFRKHFRISFKNIIRALSSSYTEFEVLTALKNMIDKSIIIKNRYGFSSYLREDKNIYFLVNNLSITDD